MAGLLLAAALALPALLAAAPRPRRPRRPPARSPQWAWADARQELGGLSLALMALLLALAVNVGVGTMVESFRRTFTGYLDQRLAAEVYVTARDDAEAAAHRRLARRPPRGHRRPADLERRRPASRDWPLELYGFRDHATYRDNWPLLAALPDAWDRVARGEAALVSEQIARRFGLAPRRHRSPCPTPPAPGASPSPPSTPTTATPRPRSWSPPTPSPPAGPTSTAAASPSAPTPPPTPRLLADLRAAFALDGGQVVDQRGLKAGLARASSSRPSPSPSRSTP